MNVDIHHKSFLNEMIGQITKPHDIKARKARRNDI